jgi:flagellar biosynthesis/type III secretory pathway protein FliH
LSFAVTADVMTQILKLEGDHSAAVRSLDLQSLAKLPSPGELRIAELQAEIQELQQALRDAETARVADVEAARIKGRDEATGEIQRDEEKALALLQSGLRDVIGRLNQHFADADKLGLTFALAALEKIVTEPTLYRKLVTETIGAQVIGLRQDTIVSISVSAHDFNDQSSLNDLAAALGADANIAASASLPAGECRIKLRLGAIDISLSDYWARLQAQCKRLLGEGPP